MVRLLFTGGPYHDKFVEVTAEQAERYRGGFQVHIPDPVPVTAPGPRVVPLTSYTRVAYYPREYWAARVEEGTFLELVELVLEREASRGREGLFDWALRRVLTMPLDNHEQL